ncbi:coiled-coil domain-containing protein [Nonomuraea rubra]|uniref:coiled-coil domain-containing protein n=1 Tax=Nonomuraea rubra TaxID=46180 RepID=UPI0033F82CA5
MTNKSDVKKLVETETERLGFTMQLANGKFLITNPENGRTGEIPLQAMGRGLDNYKTKIRSLLNDHPTKPSPMVAATDPAPEKADTMPRDTWWSVDELVGAALANGIKPYVSGGLLHTPGPVESKSYADMLHARETEVIAYLTKNTTTATTEGDTDVPKIGDTATVVRSKPRDIFADAEALWGLLRDAARDQGDKPLTNGNVPGVQWVGALADIIKAACPDWDSEHEKDVRQYLNRTEHTRCHRPRANPPVWWIALEWNDGGLTITKTTPKPDPRTVAAAAAKASTKKTPTPVPAQADTAPPATAGPALRALLGFEQAIQRTEAERDQAIRERDDARTALEEMRADRDNLLVELDEMKAERDQAKTELDAINAVFARYNGGTA